MYTAGISDACRLKQRTFDGQVPADCPALSKAMSADVLAESTTQD